MKQESNKLVLEFQSIYNNILKAPCTIPASAYYICSKSIDYHSTLILNLRLVFWAILHKSPGLLFDFRL